MLHILFTVLKIIGILLLVILGILLFIVLSVLFVPVCYRAQGQKAGADLYGKAAVSWLFRLIYVRVLYAEGKPAFEIYLFGIPLLALKSKLDTWKKKRRGKKARKRKSGKTNVQPEERPTKKSQSKPKETIKEKPAVPSIEASKGKMPDIASQVVESSDSVGNKIAGLWNKMKNLVSNILHFPGKVMERIRKIRLTFRQFCDKIKQWYTFLQMDDTRQAVRFLKGKGRLLIRHVMPRRITGKVLFGFEDPSLTGKILAAASLLCPLYKNKFEIIPVFDRTVLEGEVKLRGRIFGGYLLLQAFLIYRCREVKATYQRFQQKEA